MAPECQFLAQPLGLAENLLGSALIVPEAGLTAAGVEFGQALFLDLEVKDAPTSPGSGLPGRGSRPAPLRAASRVLQQDRTELDQAQGALAPGNNGVHAGAVDVVGADTTVAIAIEGCGIATVSAVSLTSDEIDECLFFCLLHYSPQCDGNHPLRRAALKMTGPGTRRAMARVYGLNSA
jgi:hypothetical protein